MIVRSFLRNHMHAGGLQSPFIVGSMALALALVSAGVGFWAGRTTTAKRMGADAIVGVRFTSTEVMSSAAEFVAYGTAVKLGDA